LPLSRFRTSKRGPLRLKHIVLVILIVLTLASIQGFLFVERNLEPALKEIARTYVKQIATLTINEAISKKITEDIQESHEVIKYERDQNGRITLITFDESRLAKIVTQVTDHANLQLMKLSKEPIKIPIGQALDSNILAQIGPNVPITLVPMGAARADIEVRMEEAGINVVSLIFYLKVHADVRVVIPFSSDEAIVSTEFPIHTVVLPGDVPHVYVRNGDGNMSQIPISIPTGD
jgi:sporulation protein YunB